MNKHFLTIAFVCMTFSCMCQISLNFPLERSVFQRNNNNIGFISISGTTPQVVDSIQVRLTNRVNNVVTRDWSLIDNDSDKGYFQDRIEVIGGWYKLDIRTWKNNRIDDFRTIQKVGVGEVFVISGQSNAQGVRDYGAVGAKSDLVNAVNYFNTFSDPLPPRSFEIVQLSDDVDIAPNGKTPWCWGELGDQLVNRLGVPVLFFNSAWQGTLSVNWFQSAQNIPTLSAVGEGILPTGFPYKNLETSLSYYASLFGVRSVLWMQGETDTAPGIPNYQEYYDYIGFVIRQSRNNFGHNVPWVMARTSWVDGLASDLVLSAQRDLINTPGLNVFEGPYTDTLMIPRFDFVHFGNTESVKGLTTLATAWSESLTDQFFTQSVPILTDPFVNFEANCAFFSAELKVPDNNSVYFWNDGGGGTSRTASSGTYNAVLINAKQNYKVTNMVNLGLINHSGVVRADAEKTRFCSGDSVLIRGGEWSNILWNTGATAQEIYVKTTRNVSYEAFNSIGCKLGNSNSINVNRIVPPTPYEDISFTISGSNFAQDDIQYNLCLGDTLKVKSDQFWESYLWNDVADDQEVSFSSNTNLSFRAQYGGECFTPLIEVGRIRFSEPLPPPTIERSSIYSLTSNIAGLSGNEEITYEWLYNNEPIGNVNSQIGINQEGNYVVNYTKTSNGITCPSSFSSIFSVTDLPDEPLIVYPNPAKNELNLESPATPQSLKLKVYNMRGQLVYSNEYLGESVNNFNTIKLDKLNSGMYLLHYLTPERLFVKRFIKI